MEVLVGRDDGAGDLRSAQQFAMIGGGEIGANPGRHLPDAVRVLLRKPDPFDRGMARRDLAAKQADPAAADDREPDALGGLFHRLPFCCYSRLAM